MKYLKSYNEVLKIGEEQTKILTIFNQSMRKLEDDYRSKIEDCILYLTDNLEFEYNYNEYNDDFDLPLFSYSFLISKEENREEIFKSLESSIDRLKHELDAQCNVGLCMFRESGENMGERCNYIEPKPNNLSHIKLAMLTSTRYAKSELELTLVIY